MDRTLVEEEIGHDEGSMYPEKAACSRSEVFFEQTECRWTIW